MSGRSGLGGRTRAETAVQVCLKTNRFGGEWRENESNGKEEEEEEEEGDEDDEDEDRRVSVSLGGLVAH